MEKITLTQKQANALEMAVQSRLGGKGEVLMEHGNYCVQRPSHKPQYWEGANEPLNDLSFDGMAMALYCGYDIEQTPEDKVRGWYEDHAEMQRNNHHNLALVSESKVICTTIYKTLELLNIKIEGVNA